MVTGWNGGRLRSFRGWVRSPAPREGGEAVACAVRSACTRRARRAAAALRAAAAARRLAAAGGRLAPAARALTAFLAAGAGTVVTGCGAAGAGTFALFLSCPGAADRIACPGGGACERPGFGWRTFACPRACPGFAALGPAPCECAGGPFSAGGVAKAGHAKVEPSRAVPITAGTRCDRERGGATVTNFRIGQRMRSMVGGPSPAVDYSVRNPALCEILLSLSGPYEARSPG